MAAGLLLLIPATSRAGVIGSTDPSARGDNADPSSRLDESTRRRRADGGGGNDPRIDQTAAPEAFASRDQA